MISINVNNSVQSVKIFKKSKNMFVSKELKNNNNWIQQSFFSSWHAKKCCSQLIQDHLSTPTNIYKKIISEIYPTPEPKPNTKKITSSCIKNVNKTLRKD